MHLDSWAQKAKQIGYRSRAVFKLEEILHTINKIKNNSNVLDLGAAQGGWSQLKGDFDLVISDIAPNLSGIRAVDSENIFELNKLTIEVASSFLKTGGYSVMKTFQNSMLKSLRKDMELSFKIVQTYKPAASKKQSGEIYLYGEM